jgi:hypothetical protein
MFVFTAAITGIWPIMISIDLNMSWLIYEFKCQSVDEDVGVPEEGTAGSPNDRRATVRSPPEDEKSPPCTSRAKYVWLGFSAIIIMFISALTTHIILISLGWPNVGKTVRIGDCYFIDTSRLDIETAVATENEIILPPAARSLGLLRKRGRTAGAKTAMRALATVDAEGMATFVADCGVTV